MTTGEFFAWVQLGVFGLLLLGLFIGGCVHAFSHISLGEEPEADAPKGFDPDPYTPEENTLAAELDLVTQPNDGGKNV